MTDYRKDFPLLSEIGEIQSMAGNGSISTMPQLPSAHSVSLTQNAIFT